MKKFLEREKDENKGNTIWVPVVALILFAIAVLLSLVNPAAADRTANILDKVGNLFGIFADIHINEHEVMVTLDPNGVLIVEFVYIIRKLLHT